MLLKGMHGTCNSAAEMINKEGFDPNDGRRGKGVYFWTYQDGTRPVAKALAWAWWNLSNTKKKYNKEQDKDFYCFDVIIRPERMLDLDKHDLKIKLTKFIHETSVRAKTQKKPYLADKAYDLFVKKLEEREGTFDVVHIAVNPPPFEFFNEADKAKGHVLTENICPSCYVVKNPNCIEIIK